MNHREFFDLVSKMRKAQRDYFQNRHSQCYLDYAKRLEREVDNEIRRVNKVLALTEPNLFNQPQ